MNFIQNLFLRLRLQRRRHRNLFIAAIVFLALAVFFLLFGWQDYIEDDLIYVPGLEGKCTYLPKFLCDWISVVDVSEEDQPFNPLAPTKPNSDIKPASEKGLVYKPKEGRPQPGPSKDTKGSSKSSPSQAEIEKIEYIKSVIKAADFERLALAHSFYKTIFEDIIKAKPSIEGKIEKYLNNEKCHSERYDDASMDPLFSEEYLSSFLQLSDVEMRALTASHKFIRGRLPESAPAGLYQGDGIVYVGGGKFNWLTLLSIRGLRGGGCELPVEILIPTLEEYDLHLCSKVFPAMNAKCIYLPTELYGDDSEMASSLAFKGYQYKSLAILLSSFENALLMDSDNMAAYSPDHLFHNEPFSSRGLVVWPDFWRRSTSPSFYKIAGEDISESELLPRYSERFGFYREQSVTKKFNVFKDLIYHERKGAIPDPSSESGQLMISKKSHLKAILLALYYNSYGPKFYYPIFSQGAQGEGDKETFLAATVVLKKPFYQVGKFLTSLGNVKHDVYTGHAMGQHDPVEDYKLSKQKSKLSSRLTGNELEKELKKLGDPKMLFLHANFPKLDPWALKEAGETLDKDGRHRLYGKSLRWRTGTDLEMDIWKHMNTILCQAKLEIDHFKDIEREVLCEEIGAQIKHLISTVSTLE